MTPAEQIKEKALSVGFSLAGITTAEPPPHLPAFQHWLRMGRNGSMDYLQDSRRSDPRLIMGDAKTILVLAARYPKVSTGLDNFTYPGRIAAYALVEDYHNILPRKMLEVCEFIEKEIDQPIKYRIYTDTGPLLEKDLAQRAGLGWIGKNTCLINTEIGSFFFLGEILLDIELEPDPPFAADRCGTCQRCLEACPTSCILPDRTIDARRCISYLTIENKGEIPTDLRADIGNWIFGCDICQDVCPWNNQVKVLDQSFFPFFPKQSTRELENELSLSSQEFNSKYKNSPILRARRSGYLRNKCVVLGNLGNPASIPALELAEQDTDRKISAHAEWAVEQIRRKNKVV